MESPLVSNASDDTGTATEVNDSLPFESEGDAEPRNTGQNASETDGGSPAAYEEILPQSPEPLLDVEDIADAHRAVWVLADIPASPFVEWLFERAVDGFGSCHVQYSPRLAHWGPTDAPVPQKYHATFAEARQARSAFAPALAAADAGACVWAGQATYALHRSLLPDESSLALVVADPWERLAQLGSAAALVADARAPDAEVCYEPASPTRGPVIDTGPTFCHSLLSS